MNRIGKIIHYFLVFVRLFQLIFLELKLNKYKLTEFSHVDKILTVTSKGAVKIHGSFFILEAIMACFLVPLGEALAVSAAKNFGFKEKPVWKERLSALEQMLYGGSFLLAIEHVYHGEVIFEPPFLTAMKSPEETAAMLHELSTTGLAMALSVTAIWGLLCFFRKKKTQGLFRMAIGALVMFGIDGLFAAFS